MAEISCAMVNDFWTNSVCLLEEQKASSIIVKETTKQQSAGVRGPGYTK
jgi:hypothetical protein